jgi:Gram-negative bacterial TonB protein C-terminal
MRLTLFTLILTLLVISPVLAQENKAPDQKPSAPTSTTETEKPKNEVERILEDAAKSGEKILASCVAEPCGSEIIDDGVEKGRALRLPQPRYPPIARAAHVSGEVKVQVIIDEEGKVIAAAAISGHPLLFGVSVAAAREATFTPTRLFGKPVKVFGEIQYNFVAK